MPLLCPEGVSLGPGGDKGELFLPLPDSSSPHRPPLDSYLSSPRLGRSQKLSGAPELPIMSRLMCGELTLYL